MLLEVGVGKEFQGGDVGIAIDDTAHELGARIRRNHRSGFDPRYEVVERANVTEDPADQRQHQAPVCLGKQHQRTDRINQYMPQGVHCLHG
ncbi:hypothetical protein D3C71_1875550 [compost metagenome]